MSALRDKCFQGDLDMMSSVLALLKGNLLLSNHWTKSLNSCLIKDSIEPIFLPGSRGKVIITNDHFLVIYFIGSNIMLQSDHS